MKLERTKNAARSVVFGGIAKVYNLAIPFVMRTIMIYTLGMEYLGINSLFASVLSVLSLAELGVGTAMVFSMYKPLAEDDNVKICALMNLYKKYYRIIGGVILVIGLILLPFIPNLITGDIPADMNVYVLYLLNLAVTVLTYWLFAYKNCLLNVHQRNDIAEKIALIINTVKYGGQIAVLYAFKNYYIYIIVAMVMGVVSNIVTALVVDKLYPQFKATGKLDKAEVKAINKRVADLFTARVGSIIVESSDTLVISAFIGLVALAQYQNYYYIENAVMSFLILFTTSALAGIGNSLVTETKQKNFNDFKKFTFLFVWLGIVCVCCFACIYQPFMELWVGEENLLDYPLVILFCIHFFVKLLNTLFNLYKDAAGIWNQDKYRCLVVALSNLGMNLVMVHFWGLYGILLSTIVSMVCIGIPWLLSNLFSSVFKVICKKYVVKLLVYVILCIGLTTTCVFINSYISFDSLIVTIVARLIVCAIIPNIILVIVFRKSAEFKGIVAMINSLTKGKIKILKKLM